MQVAFVGGSKDGQIGYARYPVARGETWEVVSTGEVWIWDGRVFVFDHVVQPDEEEEPVSA